VWIAAAGFGAAAAPSAGYLWSVPLFVAGLGLLAVPVASAPLVRVVSVLVLAVTGSLWLFDTVELLRFIVALFGRLPMITPVWIYAALMLACGAMVMPPFIAVTAATRPLSRPSLVTAALLVAVAVTLGFAYSTRGYTYQQPQRRFARVLVEPSAATATYEVASHEPGLDLAEGAPGGWYRAVDVPAGSVPFGRYQHPFVFRTTAPSPGAPPASVTAFAVRPIAGGSEVTMTVVPSQPGLSAAFVLPEGVTPARSNWPGIVSRGRWRAAFVGIPAEGITWQASFKPGLEEKLSRTNAVVTSSRFPGGAGWQSLPAWLPQDRTVWDMDLTWILR
jgi:hypothetical protein